MIPRHAERPDDLLDRLRLTAGDHAVAKRQHPLLVLGQLGQRAAECFPVQDHLGLLRGPWPEGRHQFTEGGFPFTDRLVQAGDSTACLLDGHDVPDRDAGFTGDLFPRRL